MKYAFLIFQCFLFAISLNGQSIFDVYRDPAEIKELESMPLEEPVVEPMVTEELANPFEVSHIPIRKKPGDQVSIKERFKHL